MIIWYFYKAFKLFIKVKINKQDQSSTSFEEIVQKAINIKAKIQYYGTRLQYLLFQELPLFSYHHFKSLDSRIQYKELKLIEFKPKISKLANENFFVLPYTNKLTKPICQNKKKVFQKKAGLKKLYLSNKKKCY